jgi:hypothetical protein
LTGQAPVLLSMTHAERIFLREEPGFPSTIHAEARIPGQVAPRELRDAVGAVLAAHPFARGALAEQGADAWIVPESVPCPAIETAVEAEADDFRNRLLSEPLRLDRPPLLRVGLVRGRGTSRIILVVHHAMTDGMGGLCLLRGVLGALRGQPPAVDRSWLGHREVMTTFGAAPGESRDRRVHPRPGVAAPAAHGGEPGAVGFGFLEHDLGPVSRPSLPGAGAAHDVLVAGLHLAIERWNRALGARAEDIGVAVPVNLRPISAFLDGVCNCVAVWPVQTTAEQRADPAVLFQAVRAAVNPVRAGQYSPALRRAVGSAFRMNRAPLWTLHALARTTLLSTLNSAAADGADARHMWMDGIEISGSVAPAPTVGVAFATWVSAGRRRLGARYRRDRFGAAEVRALLGSVGESAELVAAALQA